MVIYGTRTRNRQIGQGTFYCPKCEEVRDYRHMQSRQFFTLYFIPLIPMGVRGEWWECTTCTRAYKPPPAAALAPSTGRA